MGKADFVQDGFSVDYTPGSAVSAGDIVIQGDLVGIAKLDIAANALGALATRGVFDIVKEGGGGVTFEIGDEVYWDATNSVAVATATGNAWLGYCVKAAVDADVKVRTFLNPGGELPTSAHIADVAAPTQGTYTASTSLTDPPTKAEAEAELALIDAELDKIKVDIAAGKTTVDALLAALEGLGLLAAS